MFQRETVQLLGARSSSKDLRPQSTFIPPTVEEPTFGPQNPFFPPTITIPPLITTPHLPPSHISRYEIGAYADLYKDGASIPQIPGISNPQTPPPTQRPAPSFGSVVAKTVAHHLFKHSRFTQLNLVQTDPAMAVSSLSNPDGPSGFDPELQAKFPEAYAFAVRVDRFGKEQIALLKVTMEPSKPHLFKEFALLGRLLKKGTGHDLYTPGVHTEGFQPVAIKVEAMVLEAAQFTKSFALQRLNNPIQADIDVTLGVLRGAGELAKGTFRFLLDTHNPNDVISRDMLSTLDILASNIDMRFTSMIHQINPGYDPYSPASKAGSELFKALIFERILIGKTAAITRGGARAVEGLAARSEVAYVEQRALLGRMNSPAYRSGFVSEKTARKLAERNIEEIKLVIEPKKYNYIFGIVKRSEHNSARAAHNASQMRRLGISNSAEGRVLLEKHFDSVLEDPSNIIKKYSNQFGTYEIRESILSGPSGKFAKLESSFEILPDGSRRFITTIPKGG